MPVDAVYEANERLKGTSLAFQLLSTELIYQLRQSLLNMSLKACCYGDQRAGLEGVGLKEHWQRHGDGFFK